MNIIDDILVKCLTFTGGCYQHKSNSSIHVIT